MGVNITFGADGQQPDHHVDNRPAAAASLRRQPWPGHPIAQSVVAADLDLNV